MTDIVFSAKALEAMQFLAKYLTDTDSTFTFSVPKINADGEEIKSLSELAAAMKIDTKVAAAYVSVSTDVKQEIFDQAQEVLHPGIYSSADDAYTPVVNYAYQTAKNFDKTELKAIRMVRTISGSRRFGQPRGSIIIRDGGQPLDALVALVNDVPGYDKLADKKGRVFYVGQENGAWTIRDPLSNTVVHKDSTQEGSLSWLNEAVGGSPSKDKGKETTSRAPGATGHRPTGDEERDEVLASLDDERNEYQLDKGQKTSVVRLTTEQLVIYKAARDKGMSHEAALKLAQSAGTKPQTTTTTKKPS